MKFLAAASFALCTMMGHAVAGQTTPVVVELFTSQGCSSCPPADKLLSELAQRDDVLALALHVDYWDYIGWADSFALPEHAERQRRYAHKGGRDMIYTPQMIVNGEADVVGAHALPLSEIIARYKAQPPAVALSAERDGTRLSVLAEALTPVKPDMTVLLVRYVASRSVEITRGENAGHTLDYVNVVDSWQVLGHWDGAAPLTLTAEIEGPRPAAVLVQYPGPGVIVAAARVD